MSTICKRNQDACAVEINQLLSFPFMEIYQVPAFI
jgi:hypothetical protein